MSEENESITLTPSPSIELSTSMSTDDSKKEELDKSKDIEDQLLKQNISLVYGNDYKLKNPKKLGNSFVFWYIKDWPLITIGPDCLCLLGTTSFFYFLELFTIFEKNFQAARIIETLSYLFFLFSYLGTSLINPGIPELKYYSKNFQLKDNEKLSDYQKCHQCNIIIPKKMNVTHCNVCKVCVSEQDHHCPWTGKCIGKYNIIQFYCFLFFLLIYIFSTFVTFLLFIVYIQDETDKKKKNH